MRYQRATSGSILFLCLVLAGAVQAQPPSPEQGAPDTSTVQADGNDLTHNNSEDVAGTDSVPVQSVPPAQPDAIAVAPAPSPPATTTAPPTDGPSDLGEVLVTSTRRPSSINKVPVAISEISGEALELNVIRDTQSLVQQAPSLNIQFSGSEANATIRIRGIGTGGGNAGFESSVGVFIDGVYLPRPGLALTDLVDIERVEVLRGPQGTLFGKNTTVGAIQILTREPSFSPEAELRIGAGSFNSRIASAMVSGPVTDTLALRLTGQIQQRDGYVTNLFNGEKYNDRDRHLVRAQALFQPSDAFSLRLIATTNEKNERCCVAPFTGYNPATAANIERHGGTVFDPPSEYSVSFDYTDTYSNAGEDSYSAQLNWNFGEVKLRGLVSYGEGFAEDKRDGDFSDVDIAYQPYVNAQTEITTGELTLQGGFGNLDWLVGAFYSDETIGAQAQTLLGRDAGSFTLGNIPPGTPVALYPAGTGSVAESFQDGTSGSLFTHNVISLGGGFETTLGLRYLTEEKIGGGEATSNSPSCAIPLVQGGTVPTVPGAPNATATTNSLRLLCAADDYNETYDDQRITGTAALAKSFKSGLYTYLGYSRGFKSGGLNLNPASTVGGTVQFRPEIIDNYEAGLRWRLFEGALQTRVTFFYMDLTDYQINAFDGTTFTVSNAGHVIAEGVEFESDVRLDSGLSFKGNFTYTDASYAEGTANVGFGSSSVIGKQLTNSPEWVGQLGTTYTRLLPNGITFFGSLSARYQSAVNTGVDLNPGKDQEAYTLVNGRVGLRFPGDYEISASAANLLDEYYRQIIFDAVARPPVGTGTVPGTSLTPMSFNGYPGTPRMVLLELRKRFQ